jgi:hypothetical protein
VSAIVVEKTRDKLPKCIVRERKPQGSRGLIPMGIDRKIQGDTAQEEYKRQRNHGNLHPSPPSTL